jgi:adenylosuccinate lyase
MAVFAIRLSRERREISQVEIMGKFAGAVGNYNAHLVAYPDVKWPQIAEDFVQSLGLSFNPYVTQVSFLHLFFLQSKNFFWASSIHFTFLSNIINS